MAFVRHKTFISLKFDCLSSSLLILGDFKVTCCVLVDITTSSSVLQLRLLQTRNSALSLESKYQQFYQTKNCASIPKIKLKQSCRCHLPSSNISMQNSLFSKKRWLLFFVFQRAHSKSTWLLRDCSSEFYLKSVLKRNHPLQNGKPGFVYFFLTLSQADFFVSFTVFVFARVLFGWQSMTETS